jgi:hypothetical protein
VYAANHESRILVEEIALKNKSLKLEFKTLKLADKTLKLEFKGIKLEFKTLKLADKRLKLEFKGIKLEFKGIKLEFKSLKLADKRLKLEDKNNIREWNQSDKGSAYLSCGKRLLFKTKTGHYAEVVLYIFMMQRQNMKWKNSC